MSTTTTTHLQPTRLRPRDILSQGLVGLRAKRLRTLLTAVGITIGIAAMVAVVGISASSKADLLAELDSLGTNLLQVQPGNDMFGESSELPLSAPAMIRRIGPVESASATRTVDDATVRRTDLIPSDESGGLSVLATEPNLLDTLDGTLQEGTFLNDATGAYPSVVLGSVAAERLGITHLDGDPLVFIGGKWFKVIGLLDPVPLAPDIDRSVMIGYDVAKQLFGIDDAPSTVRVRTDPDHTDDVWAVLAATANPESPNEVDVSRPSDALAAKAQADETLTALLLGLGAVALLVGGVGIANVMVISVLERRAEIGVRRALGATRRHIRLQFLVEAVLLAGLGGAVGVALGAGITAVYAHARDWMFAIPQTALLGGVAASLVVGGLAGLYPAARASRLAPAEAVRAE
ncbi:MAG TPA: ABC transporter permease [Acidimicrobiales bacterium]|nr:ABC transporter permease [Acidimicrobiales bacterium]